MKVEFNNEGLLLLLAENETEEQSLMYWCQKNNGKIYIPKEKTKLAVTVFNTISVAICRVQ